jgi:hypothetical protein
MAYGWHENGDDRRRGTLAIGLFLVVLGVLFFASEQANFDFGRYGWPMYVIVPGAFLLLLGLAVPHEGGLGAAIPGGIITTVGLVLAFQNATGAYASWTYAWALVAPGSVGVTLALFGLLHRRGEMFVDGVQTAAVGLCLFVGFGLFFENILGVDDIQGTTALRDALPIMAVVLGVLIVLWNLLPPRWRSGRRYAAWNQPEPPSPPIPPAPPAPPVA